jgi:hypothetical protein
MIIVCRISILNTKENLSKQMKVCGIKNKLEKYNLLFKILNFPQTPPK